MSKRYLVKETSVATEKNPNFKGETICTYYGKGSLGLKREGFSDKDMSFWEQYTSYQMTEAKNTSLGISQKLKLL